MRKKLAVATEFENSISIEQFRRKKSPAEAGQEYTLPTDGPQAMGSAEPISSELSPRTGRRTTAALAAIQRLKQKEMALIAATPSPKQYRIQFSTAAVAREAGIGRTQLYEGHGGIREAIHIARSEIEALLDTRVKVRRPSSKRALEETINALKTRHQKEMALVTSQQLSELMRHMGPRIDEAQLDANKIKILENKIYQLEAHLAEANATIKALTKKAR